MLYKKVAQQTPLRPCRASVPVMRRVKGIGEHLILSRINVRCKEMASRNFAVANTIFGGRSVGTL
ncbi:hypothetical protein AYI70_g2720, partial [Smittium culicis]